MEYNVECPEKSRVGTEQSREKWSGADKIRIEWRGVGWGQNRAEKSGVEQKRAE